MVKHRLLKRLLKRLALDEHTPPTHEQWQELIERIERTYVQNDQDRYLLERSLTISSNEMRELNEQIQHSSQIKIALERNKLQAIIQSLAEGLCVLDTKGHVTLLNPAGEAMLGWREEELLNQPVLPHVRPPNNDLDNETLMQLLQSGQTYSQEDSWLNHKTDGFFPAWYLMSPVMMDGVFQGVVWAFRNTKHRKEAEQALQAAKEEAEQANRAKSDFLASMSHELRTPLSAILGYSELLIEQATEKQEKSIVPKLQNIQIAGNHLLTVVNEILDLSKIESGRIEFYPTIFDVSFLINEIASTMEPLLTANGNLFTCTVSKEVTTITHDEDKTKQILLNLIGNASKFTLDGCISLSVTALTNKQVQFVITDTGIGMTEEQLAKVFDPFTQADQMTRRKYGGTGLGLSITKELCELMGGSIGATSQEGVGSIFTVTLPFEYTY